MGRGRYFNFDGPRAIFEELRVASRGGNADYYGISYEKIERQNGVFWPCPTEDHPGTPRLFEERFYHTDGKARFHPVEYNPPAETPDDEYPLILTSGRVVYQYLSGNQTRRIGFLVEQCPEPFVEIHSETARNLPISDGERVRAWGPPVFFLIGDLRASVNATRLGPPKSASEGAERDREWKSIVPSQDGEILEVAENRVVAKMVSGRRPNSSTTSFRFAAAASPTRAH
jgi:assimilatory nitrate reductase catalytic subunit